jgi:hypothetical protein
MSDKPKRVDCSDCENFIWPVLTRHGMVKIHAKCKLGKRVMFRLNSIVDFGWIRFCNDYKGDYKHLN